MPTEINTTQTTELPSITGFLKDPKTLKIIVIVSVVANILLFIGLISASGSSEPAVRPTPLPTAGPTTIPRETILPTKTPSEEEAELIRCFTDCTDKQFVETAKSQLKDLKHLKATTSFTNLKTNKCYGKYIEASAEDKEYIGNFVPNGCDVDFTYQAQPLKYIIGADVYLFSEQDNTWEKATSAPIRRLRIIDTLELVTDQQVLKSDTTEVGGETLRVITGTSEIINDFNQVINKTVVVKINQKYELVYYSDTEKNGYIEEGVYYDLDVPNSITKPSID